MAIIRKPSARDPRFVHDAPGKTPGDVARAAAEAKVLRCGRSTCGAQVPVAELSEEARRRYAETLGFVVGTAAGKEHVLYCSASCREMDSFRVDVVCSCPTCRLRVDDRTFHPGPKVCSGPVPRPEKKAEIARVTVRDVRDRQDRTHRSIVCDRWACDTTHYVDPAMSFDRIAAYAASAGFVETEHGTVCGPTCALAIRRDVAAGRQDPIEMSKDLEAKMVAEGRLPPGAVSAKPAPGPEERPKRSAARRAVA